MLRSFNRMGARLTPVSAHTFATNEKAVKLRMKAVDSIRKITKAMKMVASSKMRMDMQRLNAGKDFGFNFMQKVFQNDTYVMARAPKLTPNRILAVAITTDRGLCGSINSNMLRELRQDVSKDRSKYQIICIGDKGTQALARPFPDLLKESVNEVVTPLNFYNVACISEVIRKSPYPHDAIHIYYNHFINSISQKPMKMEVWGREQFTQYFKRLSIHEVEEPENEFARAFFYELYVAGCLYHTMLQNAASEQTSRMNAMENASKNAAEILGALNLEYNKARQARITNELCEIISGASAL